MKYAMMALITLSAILMIPSSFAKAPKSTAIDCKKIVDGMSGGNRGQLQSTVDPACGPNQSCDASKSIR